MESDEFLPDSWRTRSFVAKSRANLVSRTHKRPQIPLQMGKSKVFPSKGSAFNPSPENPSCRRVPSHEYRRSLSSTLVQPKKGASPKNLPHNLATGLSYGVCDGESAPLLSITPVWDVGRSCRTDKGGYEKASLKGVLEEAVMIFWIQGSKNPPPWPDLEQKNDQIQSFWGKEGKADSLRCRRCSTVSLHTKLLERYKSLMNLYDSSQPSSLPLFKRHCEGLFLPRATQPSILSLSFSYLEDSTHSWFYVFCNMDTLDKRKGMKSMVLVNVVPPPPKSRKGSKSRNESKNAEGTIFSGEGGEKLITKKWMGRFYYSLDFDCSSPICWRGSKKFHKIR